jgi:hypothetical protein
MTRWICDLVTQQSCGGTKNVASMVMVTETLVCDQYLRLKRGDVGGNYFYKSCREEERLIEHYCFPVSPAGWPNWEMILLGLWEKCYLLTGTLEILPALLIP